MIQATSGWSWARVRAAICAALAGLACACGGTVRNDSAPPFLAVMSAFPAEMAPLLEQATIDETTMINGRVFRVGTLGGVRVVIGLTGIGLVNATTTTRAVLDQFAVTGVVFSGVAGTTLRIGDVTVPVLWSLKDGTTYAASQQWLALAAELGASDPVSVENCTVVPASGQPVCLSFEPTVVVGGTGESSDPYGSQPVLCRVNGDDVFGCDVPSAPTAPSSTDERAALRPAAAAPQQAPVEEDMETAAVARAAAARGLPFIGFRATSDGADDPLGLPGFPSQFFAYYRLAAYNAAAATVAFLRLLAAGAA